MKKISRTILVVLFYEGVKILLHNKSWGEKMDWPMLQPSDLQGAQFAQIIGKGEHEMLKIITTNDDEQI